MKPIPSAVLYRERVIREIVETEQELKSATEQLEYHSTRALELAATVVLLSSRFAVLRTALTTPRLVNDPLRDHS